MRGKLARLILTTTLLVTRVLAEGDVEVIVPDQATAVQRVPTNTLRILGDMRLPYETDPQAALSTIGQLCKQSEVVVVGNVLTVRVTEAAAALSEAGTLTIEMGVETNLLGEVRSATVAFAAQWTRRAPIPQPGTKVIAFLSTETFSPIVHHTLAWSFDRTRVRGRAEGQFCLLGKERGMLRLEAQDADALISVTMGYLWNLRQPDRDAYKYYRFLRQQMDSVIPRIRNDATQDFLYLAASCKTIDLDDVAKDAGIDENVRNYVNLVLRPARAAGTTSKVEVGP